MNAYCSTAAATLLSAVMLAAPLAQAAPVAIVNPSFEADVFGDGGFSVTAPSGWTAILSGGGGTFNPNINQLVAPTDGQQVGYLNGVAGFSQTLADTVKAGSYSLKTDFAFRKDCCSPGSFTLDLLAGPTLLGSFQGSTSNGFSNTAFKTAAVDVVVADAAASIGQALVIRISGASSQIDFDNVRLDFAPTAVPLPASALLLLPALVSVAGLARRRSRA